MSRYILGNIYILLFILLIYLSDLIIANHKYTSDLIYAYRTSNITQSVINYCYNKICLHKIIFS